MRKTLIGVIVSDKMQQTAVIEVSNQKVHPILGKRYSRSSKFFANNPDNQYKAGDKVEIAETKPQSKNKRWEILKKIDTELTVKKAEKPTAKSKSKKAK